MADSVAVFTPGQRLNAPTGVPYESCTAEFYQEGSSSPYEVYSDYGLTVSLGAVLYFDSAGYPVSAEGSSTKVLVYASTTPYKIVFKNAGVEWASHPNVKGAVISGSSGSGSGITQAQGDVRYIRNPDALSSVTTIDAADLIPLRDVSASANKAILFSDIVDDIFAAGTAAGLSSFPSGFKMPAYIAAAPTGWTKDATNNDCGVKISTGVDGGTTTGTAAYSSTFASRTPAGTVGGTSLSTAQLAAHKHDIPRRQFSTAGSGETNRLSNGNDGGGTGSFTDMVNEGSGTTHTHSFTGSALDFAVKSLIMIIITKN
jgi:hypothetical protein